MLVNRLYVTPTPDTLSYLSSLFSGAPVDLDMSSFKVEIVATEDELEIDPSRVYTGHAFNVNTYYDPALQTSSLMCAMTSADLQARARELNSEGVVRAFYDWYIPYFAIKRNVVNSETYRRWRLSIANALCQNERPLSWTGEYVVTEEVTAYPDIEFVNAMAADLQLRHNG
jgi:hypothetical protein